MKISQGTLKISATVGFGTTWLAPRLYKFLAQYPHMNLTLKVSDNPLDLIVDESDLSINSSIKEDESLIYKEFLCRPLNAYASRAYLAKYGIPRTPEDLDQHRLVTFSDKDMLPFDNVNWLLTCGTLPGIKREPYLSINSLYGIARAIEGGAGIGCCPTYVAQTCDNLVQVLPHMDVPHVRFYFTYARGLKDSPRINSVCTFLSEEAEKETAQMRKESLFVNRA